MPSFSKGEVVLVRYPFTDLSTSKTRPAVVYQLPHSSKDIIIIFLTSRTTGLQGGEFELSDWQAAGLNVPTALKRGLFTAHESLILKKVGQLSKQDLNQLEMSIRIWLGL